MAIAVTVKTGSIADATDDALVLFQYQGAP